MGMGSGKGGASVNDNVLKKVLLSYTYVSIWIFLSFSFIVFNKYILDRKMFNWPFPISLTMIHMAFCSFLAIVLVRVLKLVEPIGMSREVYLTSFVVLKPSTLSTSGSPIQLTFTYQSPSSIC